MTVPEYAGITNVDEFFMAAAARAHKGRGGGDLRPTP